MKQPCASPSSSEEYSDLFRAVLLHERVVIEVDRDLLNGRLHGIDMILESMPASASPAALKPTRIRGGKSKKYAVHESKEGWLIHLGGLQPNLEELPVARSAS